MRFNWLHITDLHHGMSGQGWLLPGVKHRFFADLEYLHPHCGPWDLILFTGDLTQKGIPGEFAAVDAMLGDLRDKLRELQPGHDPVLLAVPGNHDLARPAGSDEALALVEAWENSPMYRQRLWEGKDPLLRKTLGKAFKAYDDWWRLADVLEDRPYERCFGDEGDDLHLGTAVPAREREDLEQPGDERSPRGARHRTRDVGLFGTV